jgi:hypothetical protein
MTAAQTFQPAPRGRRWLRFSLKTIFVLVTLYCIWLAVIALRAHKQHRAVKRIQELHGAIAFAFELDADGNWKQNPQPFVTAWIRNALGEDYFRRVAIINFDEGSDPTDDDLRVLENLADVQQLTLTNRKKITDAGLSHLAGLKHLNVLVLNGTSVRGPGLRYLRGLQQMEGLAFSSTPLADDGLEHLAALTKLQWLHLNDTRVTDEGLRRLAGMKCLEDIQLVNTAVTDAGLKHVESLHRLKRILLRGTKTTHEGRAALQKALPNCRVPD